MKNFLLKSFLFSVIFCLCVSVTYLLIKARTASSWTTDTSPSSIYAETNGTLSAAKRNTLVNKASWKDMDLNDTTTPFDINCERRRSTTTTTDIPTSIQSTDLYYRNWNSTQRYAVRSLNKKQMRTRDSSSSTRWTIQSTAVTKLQYRCP